MITWIWIGSVSIFWFQLSCVKNTPSLSAPMRPRFFVGDVNFRQNFIGASPMTQFFIGASPMTKFLIGAPPMTKFLIGASPVKIFLNGASPLTLFFNGASPYLQGLKLMQRTVSVLNCSNDFLGGVSHPFCHGAVRFQTNSSFTIYNANPLN